MRKIVLVLAWLCASAPLASAAQIWFMPNDNIPRGARRDIVLGQDFPQLFDKDPQWSARTDVLQISPALSGPEGPEDELLRVNAFLKARHIKLATGALATLMDEAKPEPTECGYGIEGSRPPGQDELIFRRLKRIGMDIAYLSLDEPLTYGHYYRGPRACQHPIDDVARRVAAAVAEIRKSYPDVRVEDDEAPPAIPPAQWRADFDAWLKAYRAAAGAPFEAVTFDVNLFSDWRPRVAAGVAICKRNGVRAGIYIIKPGPGVSDAQAVAAYKQAIAAVDASKIPFDLVKIANWTRHPADNLPQSEPTTLTYVLDYYNRTHGRQ